MLQKRCSAAQETMAHKLQVQYPRGLCKACSLHHVRVLCMCRSALHRIDTYVFVLTKHDKCCSTVQIMMVIRHGHKSVQCAAALGRYGAAALCK